MATYKNLNQNLRQELRLLGSIPDKINGQTNVTYGMYMTKRMNQMLWLEEIPINGNL